MSLFSCHPPSVHGNVTAVDYVKHGQDQLKLGTRRYRGSFMVFEFVLGAALVIMTTAALIIWLASVTKGLQATLAVGGVMTLALLVLMAHTAMGVTLTEALHLLLVVGLLIAPVIAIAFADWRRAS